jgi:LysM repeat protein
MPVGYAPVPPSKERRVAGSHRGRVDPEAPSWEQPRRFEEYPTLRPRGGGIPRPAIYALIVLLVGVGLFATPFLLRGLGGGGEAASPTPGPTASAAATSPPTPTPVPTPAQVVHVVKSGDTLSKIAAQYGVTVDQILAANPQIKDPNKIAVGDKIVIPQPPPTEIVDGEVTPAP